MVASQALKGEACKRCSEAVAAAKQEMAEHRNEQHIKHLEAAVE